MLSENVKIQLFWYRSLLTLFFFFSSRRRHTRFDCDWSSDVCSSDLTHARGQQLDDHGIAGPATRDHQLGLAFPRGGPALQRAGDRFGGERRSRGDGVVVGAARLPHETEQAVGELDPEALPPPTLEIGRAHV